MTADALLKKHFTWVVLALVAVVAYFQASAATHLFGGALVGPAPATAGVAPLAHEPMTPSRPAKSAQPLLERNPFDSVTGPLTGRPIEPVSLPEPKADLSDPLSAPHCDDMTLMIVTESTDPTWSVAAIQGPGEPSPRMRRVGDDVAGKEVAFIGFNPREASPAVWFSTPSEICQALLFTSGPEPGPSPSPHPTANVRTPRPPPSRGPTKLPDDIKDKIQRVSDNEFNVDRSVVDQILENQAELMRSARIVPEQKDGKVVGIRLFGIRPDTLLGSLGLQNGDRLESINGFNMASPEKALEAYARLRTASNLNVKISRRGQSMSIDYRIK